MKILLVSTRFPLPPRRGQQVRSLEWLEALKEHELRLLCPEAPDADPAELIARIGPGLRIRCWSDSPLRRFLAAIPAFLRGHPLQEAIFETGMAKAMLGSMLEEGGLDLVIIQMVRCAWAMGICRRRAPHLPSFFDAIDAMGLHYGRRAESGGLSARISALEGKRCLERERQLAANADLVSAVSRRDLDFLGIPPEKGRVIPVSGRVRPIPDEKKESPALLLSGNLGYRPTVEGALFFARRVWPRVKAKYPASTWVLAGARPPTAIRRLGAIEGVEVVADPEDLAPFFARANLAVAPMASGSGVPMKILEAWAAGLPVVAHPWAAGGLEGGGSGALLKAEGAVDWVDCVSRVVEDTELRDSLRERGREIWRSFYHPDAVAASIREAVSALASTKA